MRLDTLLRREIEDNARVVKAAGIKPAVSANRCCGYPLQPIDREILSAVSFTS